MNDRNSGMLFNGNRMFYEETENVLYDTIVQAGNRRFWARTNNVASRACCSTGRKWVRVCISHKYEKKVLVLVMKMMRH